MEPTQLQVMLPPEVESQIYQLFVSLAIKAIDSVSEKQGKRYYSQAELQRLLNTSHETIKMWVSMGLPYFIKGNSHMYDIEDVHEFIEEKLKR